jgi:hypothetical protein
VNVYTVKHGDTLVTVAARQLGDLNRWHELARLNDIRDPRRISPGDTLRLPDELDPDFADRQLADDTDEQALNDASTDVDVLP